MTQNIAQTTGPLTVEDMMVLAGTHRSVRKFFFIFFPVNAILAVLAGVFGIIWLAVIFALAALALVLVFWYSGKRFWKEVGANTKLVLVGPVEPLISVAGGTVVAEVDRKAQRLRTRVKKGASEKQYDEPFVLSAGQADHFFYALRMGTTTVLVDRGVFLDYQQGEQVRLEATPSGTFIRCAKTSS